MVRTVVRKKKKYSCGVVNPDLGCVRVIAYRCVCFFEYAGPKFIATFGPHKEELWRMAAVCW